MSIIRAIRDHIQQKVRATISETSPELDEGDYPDGLWVGRQCYINSTSPTRIIIQWFPGDTTKLDQTIYLADPEFFNKLDKTLEQWVPGYNEPIPH